jgi:DICT domain-containing protein
MNHAAELSNLINLCSGKFIDSGYKTFEDEKTREELKNSDVFFTSSVLGMQAVSHVIEDQAISMGKFRRFYSGFQRFSKVRPQRERYEKVLKAGCPVYIFGLPDVELWQHPSLYPTALTPASAGKISLSQHWFVVLHNPDFVSMALVTRELPNPRRFSSASDKLVYRHFEGFWTYDQLVIGKVVEILDDYLLNSPT